MTDNDSIIAKAGTLSAIVIAVMLAAAPALSAASVNNGQVQQETNEAPELDLVGDGWISFYWWGDTVYGGPWTFDTAEPVTLRVTDAFCYGDQFAVFDNGEELGETSEPGSTDCGGPSDAESAYEDEDMSSGCWVLLPGSHSIDLEVTQNPFNSGSAYLRADTLVDYVGPECLPISPLP